MNILAEVFTFDLATESTKCKLNRLHTLICEAENPVFSAALGNLKGSGLLLCIHTHTHTKSKLATGKTITNQWNH